MDFELWRQVSYLQTYIHRHGKDDGGKGWREFLFIYLFIYSFAVASINPRNSCIHVLGTAAQLKVSSPWERIEDVEIMLLHMTPVRASAWIILSNPSMQISFSWLAKYELKELPQMLSGFRWTFCNLPLAHLSLSRSLSQRIYNLISSTWK
jgi:hypothetical protein